MQEIVNDESLIDLLERVEIKSDRVKEDGEKRVNAVDGNDGANAHRVALKFGNIILCQVLAQVKAKDDGDKDRAA